MKEKQIHKDLIQQCKQGDISAHRSLYNLYCRAMYNVAYRILNQREDAEDVIQESFIGAFKNIDSFREESSFGAWLKKIVVNKSINCLKARKSYDELVPPAEFEKEESEPLHFRELTVNDIKKAMQKLSDGYRTVFSLHLLEGYDHQEIAEILGISPGTSKSQYKRARQKLSELLKEPS